MPDTKESVVSRPGPSPTRPTAAIDGSPGYVQQKNDFEYKAFDSPEELINVHPSFLVIYRKSGKGGHICPNYDRLDEIDFDPEGTWILLIYSYQVINLKGRNLHPLVEVLLDKKVSLLREFDSRKYKMVEDDRPIVTDMEVYVMKKFPKEMHQE